MSGRALLASLALVAGCVDGPLATAAGDLGAPVEDLATAAVADLATVDRAGPSTAILKGPIRIVPDARGLFVTAATTTERGALLLVHPATHDHSIVAGGSAAFSVELPLVADATHLYFGAVEPKGAGLFRMPRARGAPERIAAGTPLALAVDGTHLYWSEEADQIWRAPIAGGPRELVVTASQAIRGLALDGEFVYFSVGPFWCPGPMGNLTCGSVEKAPLAGGAASVVIDHVVVPSEIAVDGNVLYVIDHGHGGTDCSATDGKLIAQPLGDGGVRQSLAEGLVGASSLVVADGAAWFIEGGMECDAGRMLLPQGMIEKQPLGGGPRQVLATQQVDPWALALDAQRAWWSVATAFDTVENGGNELDAIAGAPR